MRLPAVVLVCLVSALPEVSAQSNPICFATSGVPPVVRAEGFAELVGDIVVTCTGGDASRTLVVDFSLSLNTNITSRLAGGLSEALLLVDEPGVARLDAAGNSTNRTTPFCLSPGAASNRSTSAPCNPAIAGESYQQGTYTVYRGTRTVTPSENALTWSGIPVRPPGPDRVRAFRFANIRANAQQIGVSQTLIPSQITAFVSASNLSIELAQQPVAYVQTSTLFDVRSCSNGPLDIAAHTFRQCSPAADQRAFYDDPLRAGTLSAHGALRFREAFGSAFRPQRMEGQDASPVDDVYPSESRFVRPELGTLGVADHGTRLTAHFHNVPAGIRIFVAVSESAGSTQYSKAVLVSTDAVGATPSSTPLATRPVPTVPPTKMSLTCGSNSTPAAEVRLTEGSGMAVWEVTSASPGLNESLVFTYGIAYREVAATGVAQVTGGLAPFYAPTSAAAKMQDTAMPVPRFVDGSISDNVLWMMSCDSTATVVAVRSEPSGLPVYIDGVQLTTPQLITTWKRGETHSMEAMPQFSPSPGKRHRFQRWNGGGPPLLQTFTLTDTPLVFTAVFTTEYSLSASAGPGGTVTIQPVSADGFYDASASVTIFARPQTGYVLQAWTGTLRERASYSPNCIGIPSADAGGCPSTQVNLNGLTKPLSGTAVFSPVSCKALVDSINVPVAAAGGRTVLAVKRHPACGNWNIVHNTPWLSATPGGGEVVLTAEPNPTGAERSAGLIIAEQPVTVTQQPAPTCPAVPNITRSSVNADGYTGQFSIAAPVGCNWRVHSGRSWIQVYPLSGVGPGIVHFTVFPNFAWEGRQGNMVVGDRQIDINQSLGRDGADEFYYEPERFIRMLYFNFLGRLPTSDEIRFQLESGQPRQQLAYNFLNSAEFNNAGRFVAGLYVGLLNRDAEYGGWLFQRNALARGQTNPDLLVDSFISGAEFSSRNGALSDAAFTKLVYEQILGRTPSAAEVTWREGLLRSGLTRVAFARDLLSSPEFRQGTNARLLSFLFYATLFNRGPAVEEYIQRRDQIAASPTDATIRAVLGQIVASTEFHLQTW